MTEGAGFFSAPLFFVKGTTMPGIRLSFLRDDAQEQWVSEVKDLQPQTDTTYIWQTDQIKPDREGLHKLFDRFISSTGVVEED